MDPESTTWTTFDFSQIMTIDLCLEQRELAICSLSKYENTLIETRVSLMKTHTDLAFVCALARERHIAPTTPLFNSAGQPCGTVQDLLASESLPKAWPKKRWQTLTTN